ncbi:hypothetical protein ABEB36_005029 [Hypothenemus hampei]|uniref:Uncharacterized protein n=1 Tax=Hypothenemus hampei TaxID=57062 RepID=A0ABD1EZQ5_HYPHA
MKWLISSACVFSVLLLTTYAAPSPTGLQVSASASGSTGGGLAGILQNIDIAGLLQGVNSFVKLVGAFCPPLSQVLDNVIQNVTSTAFRVFGRIILRGGGLGGGSSSGGDSGQKVNVVLPTFPPDEDYEDEDEDGSTTVSTNGAVLAQELNAVTDASAAAEIDDTANRISKRHIRVVREAVPEAAEAHDDQEGAESAPQPGQDLNDVDDQDRNKRYSPFGGGDDHDGQTGAGSGNFLFDIIRVRNKA